MTQEYQITPPTELVLQWLGEHLGRRVEIGDVEQVLANKAARWGADQQLQLDAEQINQAWQKGADQELEACCEWMRQSYQDGFTADLLRSARRPKPPSLKERGRKALQSIHNAVVMETGGRELDVLKEIVESLPD